MKTADNTADGFIHSRGKKREDSWQLISHSSFVVEDLRTAFIQRPKKACQWEKTCEVTDISCEECLDSLICLWGNETHLSLCSLRTRPFFKGCWTTKTCPKCKPNTQCWWMLCTSVQIEGRGPAHVSSGALWDQGWSPAFITPSSPYVFFIFVFCFIFQFMIMRFLISGFTPPADRRVRVLTDFLIADASFRGSSAAGLWTLFPLSVWFRMAHVLQFDEQTRKVKDANMHDEDTFEIYDPRNPVNKRRREESKKIMKEKKAKRWGHRFKGQGLPEPREPKNWSYSILPVHFSTTLNPTLNSLLARTSGLRMLTWAHTIPVICDGKAWNICGWTDLSQSSRLRQQSQ